MQLEGYVPVDVNPWEGASGGKAVECVAASPPCTAKLRFAGAPGTYEVDVEYFDQNNGASTYQVFVGDRIVDKWIADAWLPATQPNGDSSTRRIIHGVALRPGDELRIQGFPDEGERAPLDYVEFHRLGGPGIEDAASRAR
jgi:alpha-glucuronidase